MGRAMLCRVWLYAWVLAGCFGTAPSVLAQVASDPPVFQIGDLSAYPTAEVTSVVDGDTLKMLYKGKPYTVRLIGVDTPETKHPSKPVEEYGIEASRFLENLAKGERVHVVLQEGNQQDRYGRLLAFLFRHPDGLFLNLEIVRQGYGHAYTEYPFPQMEVFTYYERRARELGKGLWGEDGASSAALEEDPGSAAPASDEDEVTVYRTRTGTKYHSEHCLHLSKSKIPISLDEARGRLGPCSACGPPH